MSVNLKETEIRVGQSEAYIESFDRILRESEVNDRKEKQSERKTPSMSYLKRHTTRDE